MPNELVIGLVVLGLLWTGGFAWAHARAVGKAKAAETWPTAVGTVHSAGVVEEVSADGDGNASTWYNPVVAYSYSVGGKTFESTRLRFGNYRRASRPKAEKLLAPYRAAGTTQVRYNPQAPEESVLETAKPGPVYAMMAAAGLIFVAVGLSLGFAG